MSYDLRVWSVGCPKNIGGADGADWQIGVDAYPVTEGDVPSEIIALLPGIRYCTDIFLAPISASQEGREEASRIAAAIAKQFVGVVENRQTEQLVVPRGQTVFKEKREKGDRFATIWLSWWFTHQRFGDKSGIEELLDTIARALPEALPRRYGLAEPPSFTLRDCGLEHLADLLHREQGVVLYPTKPVLGLRLDIRERTGFFQHGGYRKFRCHHMSIAIDASALEDPYWYANIRTAG